MGIIYGTESNALVIGTGTSGLTALTLDSSQNTTLSGSLTGTTATFSGSNQYNKIQTFFDGSYISGWKFSDYNGGIWYDAGADDLTINSGFVNSQILFNTGSSERMRLTSGGNLLLGTTTDTGDKLNVSGNVTTANLTSTTGNIYGSTNLFVNALNGYVNFRSNNDNIYYDGGYHIFRDSDASPEYMRLTSSGNLLLGTTTDSAKLVVKIGSANDVIQRWETTNGLAGILQTSSDFSEFNLYQPAGNAFVSLKTNGNSYFNGGNLGIGTTSPVSQIESKDGSIRTTTLNSFSNLITGRASIPSSNGFNLGGLLFQAYSTGTTYTTGAAIYSYADSSAWTSTNAPSYLSFHTTSSGSVSTSEKMQIKAIRTSNRREQQ